MFALLRNPALAARFGAVCVLACAVAFGAGYLAGRNDGANLAETRTATATINQLRKRGLINEAVDALSDADLCRELGGLHCEP